VLLATGTGGEGHNLQFCHVMLNYDLPWNPMEIEQRIGRLHRIGQGKEVQVYNFCTGGSIEDHILDVLDKKINMFELVVGEIDMILGRLQGEEEFSDLVYDLWVHHPEEAERRQAFEALARRLKQARAALRFLVDVVHLLLELKFHRLTRSLRVVWNPLTRSLDPLVCENCRTTMPRAYPTAGDAGLKLLCLSCSQKRM